MFKQLLLGASAFGLLAGLAVFAHSAAEARSQAAIIGAPRFGDERACFDESWGGIRNVCGAARQWVMPAVYDNAGGMTFHIAAQGVSGTANRVTCSAISVDQNTANIRQSAAVATVQHTGATEMLRPSVSAHGWGSAFAFCTLDAGTRVAHISY